jgi:EAL domain-containing protein (putative c-di-GMP-specific phosphodiesterase class I)
LRDADAAMDQAKAAGKARHVVFDTAIGTRAAERLDLETDLHHAVLRGEFELHYQPIVDLVTGDVREVEALIRWRHPVRGLVTPASFIPLAEHSGLIVPIGRWVLDTACRQIAEWRRHAPGAPPLVVGVNLSARQFRQPDLVQMVSRALSEYALDPAALKLEVTEGVAVEDAELAVATLWMLKGLGVRLALDDFGTGYSSLSYLKRFPIDTLKVDRSFVDGMAVNPEDAAIVRAVVAFAKALGLDVTAEGVETVEQRDALRALEADRAQGYLFGRPSPWSQVSASIASLASLSPPASLAPPATPA